MIMIPFRCIQNGTFSIILLQMMCKMFFEPIQNQIHARCPITPKLKTELPICLTELHTINVNTPTIRCLTETRSKFIKFIFFCYGIFFLYLNILAGAVIRMFWHVLGDSTFKKGLNYYLTNK